jgi:hypothetical protein
MRVDVTFRLVYEAADTLPNYNSQVAQMRAEMEVWNAKNPEPWVIRWVLDGGANLRPSPSS